MSGRILWTSRDVKAFQDLGFACSQVVRNSKRTERHREGSVVKLRQAAARAYKALIPTRDARDAAALVAVVRLAQDFVATPKRRDALLAALSRAPFIVAGILGNKGEPPPAAAVAVRLPYRDD